MKGTRTGTAVSQANGAFPTRVGQGLPASIMMKSPGLRAFVALIGPIQFWLIMIASGVIRPGYDPVRQSISDLAVGPHAWLQRGNLIAFGLLELPFVGLVSRADADVPGLRPAWLLSMASIGCILLGVFPAYEQQPPAVAAVHIASFVMVTVSLILGCFVVPGRLGSQNKGTKFRRASLAIGLSSLGVVIVLVVHVVWSTFDGPTPLVPWAGLLERVVLALLTVWLELLVLTFALRRYGRPAPEPPD
jgi:hypothetical membrane protein